MNKPGVCVTCGGELHYDSGVPEYFDDIEVWNFTCRDCGAEGYEEYKRTFLGTMISRLKENGLEYDTYFEAGDES